MPKISDIKAYEILDSRGNPTVAVRIFDESGVRAWAAVPSGASKGQHEAHELRDNDPQRYHGMGVLKAIDNIQSKIKPELLGIDPQNQRLIDSKMIELDSDDDKNNLGANSILAVSLACARLASVIKKIPLYKYIGKLFGYNNTFKSPTPMFNFINGGLHGSGNLTIQEFLVIPAFSLSIADSIILGAEIYQLLKKRLNDLNLSCSVGDEGGFTPDLQNNEKVLDLLQETIKESRYVLNRDVFLGLDFAASTYYQKSGYTIENSRPAYKSEQYLAYLISLQKKYNLLTLEDPASEDDWLAWQKLTSILGKKVKIIGDDLLVTNLNRLKKAVELDSCNSILIKVNQIGTLSETLDVIKYAREKGKYDIVVSHRSGETNDDFMADLAVGIGADFVKFGAPARGERVAKYNRLMEIFTS